MTTHPKSTHLSTDDTGSSLQTVFAVVTGASQGIGRSIALEFAKRGIVPILIARDEKNLAAVASEILDKYKLEPVTMSADLSDRASVNHLLAQFEAFPGRIEYAVNNAGFGDTTPFIDCDPSSLDEMIELNVRAVVRITHFFSNRFRSQGSGRVMNVSSTAAFQPTPYFALYGSSKSMILNLDQAINEELLGTGVHVCTLCPGPTATPFHARASSDRSLLSRITMLDADKVAIAGVSGMLRGKRLIVPGLTNQLLRLLVRLSPSAVLPKVSAILMRPRES